KANPGPARWQQMRARGPGQREASGSPALGLATASRSGGVPAGGRDAVCVQPRIICRPAKRLPTGVSDLDAFNLERRVVRPERLSHHHYEAVKRKHCQRLTRETMAKLKYVLSGAAWTVGEQLERLVQFYADASFSRQLRSQYRHWKAPGRFAAPVQTML